MKKILLAALLASGTLIAGVLQLSGTVISDNQKMITSRFMGFIKNMRVSEGDRVKKGQILYEIDSKEIEAAVKQVDLAISQARLALQMNENQLNNVLLNLARNKRLYEKDMISKYELEQLELAAKNMRDMVKIAKKQVEQAEAQKEAVLNQYKYLTIKAPNDGVVVAKKLNEGDMQIPGMPALVITDLKHLKVLVEISESNLKFVRIGKKVKIEIPSVKFKAEGTISAIIPASNPMTHKFKVKISFEKKGAFVFPGMYAKVYIPEEAGKK
ncbi:efflux RND transporter periplasmic adaptor subunit [Nitratifractor sp.]|uniref:efflux RND transporter periplasmic adaptor subunit n=1 Tax=Nitratifractor sp. TaxID=2268144 RepID=UPI0025D9FC5D|nr:efflux RND transporter periplasmic adaptor subunit [Nitratifractor sp.]